jgi:hypothetical protein
MLTSGDEFTMNPWRTSENPIQEKFAEIFYLEVKLCMLIPAKLAQDFSRRCALPVIAYRFLATHPPR